MLAFKLQSRLNLSLKVVRPESQSQYKGQICQALLRESINISTFIQLAGVGHMYSHDTS